MESLTFNSQLFRIIRFSHNPKDVEKHPICTAQMVKALPNQTGSEENTHFLNTCVSTSIHKHQWFYSSVAFTPQQCLVLVNRT